jgi:hypothetical protein
VGRSTVRRTCAAAAIGVLCSAACREKPVEPVVAKEALASAEARTAALASARVWVAPATPISRYDFSLNPPGPGSFDPAAVVECDFTKKKIGGSTPKFYCRFPNGETLKVKYGEPNGEIPAEIASTRLLAALGFPTDRMYRVAAVKCRGCPLLPQQALQCLERGGPELVCMEGASSKYAVTFEHAAIERPFDGKKIEAEDDQGWSWYELDTIAPAKGGSPRAHVDALRLVALVLAHWDNKGPNQRLVCPTGRERADGSCAAPLAIIQDLGATFGPTKMDLPNWKQVPVWADPRSCTVNMASLPYAGATFGERRIAEEGRQFALGLLRQLSREQLDALFTAAGVSTFNHVIANAHSARAWTDTFLNKVQQIERAGPCP